MPSSLHAIKKTSFLSIFKKTFPWLFDFKSAFYFGLFVFLMGFGWGIVGLTQNSFTNFYNFDYVWQFVPFAYDVYDGWHTFFKTGQLPLYTASVYLGVDNIGSNSYYGLFDPFIIGMIIFPRAWIPQLFAVATFAKFAITAMFMRLFLKKLGIKETTARFGAIALAFSGYMNFMVAFPTTVSALVYVPLILYGIERVIQDKKPGALILGLFLEGITSFFFLVVLCIWGVIYALWRFFQTVKGRSRQDNLTIMVVGVLSFAIGIAMASFSLLPSIRQSTLSGRTSSIGASYLHSVINSIKEKDFAKFFFFIFQEVGTNPGRELMALTSFFYPTFGFQSLPLTWTGTVDINGFMSIGYDAYTAAIFCYTPFVILFFYALMSSIKKRKWSHIVAITLCVYLLFTNFAYYFFYAFTGNGYGRWFMVLIPIIIYYGCWAFDNREKDQKWFPFVATALAFAGTLLTYFITVKMLDGKVFTQYGTYNEGGYFQSKYYVPSFDTMIVLDRVYDESGNLAYLIQFPTITFVFVQCGLVLIEGLLFSFFTNRKWIGKLITGFIVVEALVIGNFSYTFNWTYSSWYGGTENIATATEISNRIKAQDSSFYRVINDASSGSETFQNVAGYNFTSTFHSLMNFDVEDFALNNRMKTGWDSKTGHDGVKIQNPQWSGYYGNKRLSTDLSLGFNYYVNKSYWTAKEFIATNASFFAEEDESLSLNRNNQRVYKIKDEYNLGLGHAVDSNKLYYLIHNDENAYEHTNFYSGSYDGKTSYLETLRTEDIQLNGAMVDEGTEIKGFAISKDAPAISTYDQNIYRFGSTSNCFSAWNYVTKGNDMLFPSADASYADEGLPYFLNQKAYQESKVKVSSTYLSLQRDYGHLCLVPNGKTYFVDDPKGSYFEMSFASSSYAFIQDVPRVYLIGDTFDSQGQLLKKNQLLSFDYNTMKNSKNAGGSYLSSYSSTFGFYVKNSKVTNIVFCYEDYSSSPVSLSLSNISFKATSFTEEENRLLNLKKESLKDVKFNVNSFTFKTDYSEPKIVVTSLGYDKGWSCVSNVGGVKSNCQMLKLDGGLVGFVAPSGEATYVLQYVTPTLKLSTALGAVGLTGYLVYVGSSFFLEVKRRRKEENEFAR